MKIELLKQRFVHLGLLTCLVVGGTMTTTSRADINQVMINAINALDNNGHKDLAEKAKASHQRLIALFQTALTHMKSMADKQSYAANVNEICKEFSKFKHTVVEPMANVPGCANEYRQLQEAITTLAKVIEILKRLSPCHPMTRGSLALTQLEPYKNEFLSAA